ncbi:hypothetical protein EV697_102368 [Bisgaardia hudsonensis]|uniref:Uncharacterized protein n=1 Tax=Bisgaardia hudsonensis TaxID=109472 RepID=A0A4R2N1N4_9PAST|nr:hypothetical protein [Bisgaardia hudsonensis]QLB12956.1 hypothetical protein A6A11_04705 [Bisgaardia hudsonensis]TCP13482.1 hypothetical protein EV697_102368 [Bisgaardia hudsonensis]
MNKKTKITLRLTAIAIALGIGAQFYTNYKIDQTLQHFPYHLRDQLTLNITQKNKNFFQRELSFILADAKADKTEIITTKLTAFPFAITADFQLPTKLVKEINKKLNITIDKNTINSKFSVIGDYLQSNIITEFRDFTNNPQSFEMNLNFASKTQFMDINASLTGLKYDEQNEIKNLKTDLTLIPIGQSKYDLSELNINVDKANIYLFDGENTHITLDNIAYDMDKKLSPEVYDLSGKLTIGRSEVSSKNPDNPDNKTFIANGITTELTLAEVPNRLVFSDIKHYLNTENLNYAEAGSLLLNLLLESKNTHFGISSTETIFPQQNSSLKNIDLKLNATQNENNKFQLETSFNFDNLDVVENNKTTINKFEHHSQANSINFKNYVEFIQFLLKDKQNNPAGTEIKQLSEKLNKFLENYPEEINSQMKIGTFSNEEIQFDHLTINSKESLTPDDQYNWASQIALEKFVYPQERLSISDVTLNLPIELTQYKSLVLSYLYSYALGYDIEIDKKIKDSFKKFTLNINNAELSLNLGSTESKLLGRITNKFNLNLPLPEKEDKLLSTNNYSLIAQYLDKINFENTFTIEKSLVDNQDESLSQSLLWQEILQTIKPFGELNPYFVEDEKNYIFNIKQKNNQRWFNGKTEQQLIQDLLQQELPAEENNTLDVVPETVEPTTMEKE